MKMEDTDNVMGQTLPLSDLYDFINSTSDGMSDSEHLCPIDDDCTTVFILGTIISVCGIIANFVVLCLVSCDISLHKPTFVCIACLSVTDVVFLIARYIRYTVTLYFFYQMPFRALAILLFVCNIISITSLIASIIHVIMLSYMRYLVVVHPIKSHLWITNRRVVVSSTVISVICIGFGFYYMHAVIFNKNKDPLLAAQSNSGISLIIAIVPFTLILLFHILKANRLKKSLAVCKTKTVKQMSATLTLVLVAFLLTTLPINIVDIMKISFGYNRSRENWFLIFGQIARLLLLCNHSINPIIYFVHSPQFNKSMKRLFTHNLHQRNMSSSRTTCIESDKKCMKTPKL